MGKHYKGDVANEEEVSWKIPAVKEQKLSYWEIRKLVSHLEGEILTIIDATISEKIQNKAMKDLVKDKFSSKINWIYELCGYPGNGEEAPKKITRNSKGIESVVNIE